MALIEGFYPYDPDNALGGKARVLWGIPGDGSAGTVAIPDDFYGVVHPTTLARVGSWKEFGLTTDAVGFSHAPDGEGLEYQQTGELFQEITEVARTLTIPVGEMSVDTLKILQNTDLSTAVAASAGSAAAGTPSKPAHDIVKFGNYSTLKSYRFAFVAFRPSGTSPVTAASGTTFPGGGTQRPAMVATILPLAQLALEEIEEEYEAGSGVGAEASFKALPAPGLPAGAEHGFKHLERPGAILAQGA